MDITPGFGSRGYFFGYHLNGKFLNLASTKNIQVTSFGNRE